MTNAALESAVSPNTLRLRSAWRNVELPGWAFAFLALLWLGFLFFLGLLAIVALTYTGTQVDFPDRLHDRIWALLSLVALLWAMVNLIWLVKAANANRSMAVYGHLAITLGCGLIALGIHSVQFAQSIASQPIVMDYSDLGAPARMSGRDESVIAMEGDAEEGRKIFSTTCVTCHGPTGDGMPNLAPSLRGSSFVASADAAAIANVIRLGRAPTHPDNKTKKVMPARGGNPFLGDDKIVHLVAFVQALQSETATEGPSTDAPPPVQLAKWVMPAAPDPPTGFMGLEGQHDIGDTDSIAARSWSRRLGLMRSLTLGLTGVHCLLLIGVMMITCNSLLPNLLGTPQRIGQPDDEASKWWSLTALGWMVVTLVWLVVFLIGFLMIW